MLNMDKIHSRTELVLNGEKGGRYSAYLFLLFPSGIVLADSFFEARTACDAFKQ